MISHVSGFISGIGPLEILVVLVVALLVFGNRLPEVARSLGKGYMEFRRGLRGLEDQFRLDDADIEVGKTPPAPKLPPPPEEDDGEGDTDSEPGTRDDRE